MRSSNRFHSFRGGERAIAKVALHSRQLLHVSDKTYVDIIDVIEFHVPEIIPEFRLVIRRDMELRVPAETTVNPPRIYVKESIYDAACEGDVDCRRILAHELGHLMLHQQIDTPMQVDFNGYEQQFDGMSLVESIEDQADVFARNFLIPPGLAFSHRTQAELLASRTGTPRNIAKAAVTISKRIEMLDFRQD